MITVASKLNPFSHTPGTLALIPGTPIAAQVFPALIRFFDLSGSEKKFVKEIPLEIKGPLKDFTVVQNLEKGFLTVFAKGFCYHILPTCQITHVKNPGLFLSTPCERLSLGSHKSADWDLIKRRLDPKEIFPFWHRLGSLFDLHARCSHTGMFTLLDRCKEKISDQRPEKIVPAFLDLFLAGFEGILVPRLEDHDHQGIVEGLSSDRMLHLLAEGASLIRSLFFQAKENEISILPTLPPEFFAGRFLHLKTPIGTFHLEWTKKMIRRVLFESHIEGKVHLKFPKEIHDFRLRMHRQQKGERHLARDAMEIKSNTLYLLDRFQK